MKIFPPPDAIDITEEQLSDIEDDYSKRLLLCSVTSSIQNLIKIRERDQLKVQHINEKLEKAIELEKWLNQFIKDISDSLAKAKQENKIDAFIQEVTDSMRNMPEEKLQLIEEKMQNIPFIIKIIKSVKDTNKTSQPNLSVNLKNFS